MAGFVTVLGVSDSTPGNIVFSSAPQHLNSYYLQPNLQVTINGVDVSSHALGATITYGFDIGVSTASVEFTDDPHASNFSNVKIFCGADPRGPNYNALRFSGLFLRTEATMWPPVFTMVCRGNLYRADQFRQTAFTGWPTPIVALLQDAGFPVGQNIVDVIRKDGTVVGGYLADQGNGIQATDQNCVFSILNRVPGLVVEKGNINGTNSIILYAFASAVWPPYKSALEMVQLFDQAFLGFRTFEDVGGTIRRAQIFGYPSPSPATTFTEGIDIWEAQGTRSVETLINAVFVEGLTDSHFAVPQGIIYAYVENSNDFQVAGINSVTEQFSSPFIETSDANEAITPSSPPRLNANRVAEWRLSERNRELVNIQLTTFRDDKLGIGSTILVNVPHAAVSEPVWVQRVEIRISAHPVLFQQTIFGIGGGLVGNTSADKPSVDPFFFPGSF